jgi:hypothetical protein
VPRFVRSFYTTPLLVTFIPVVAYLCCYWCCFCAHVTPNPHKSMCIPQYPYHRCRCRRRFQQQRHSLCRPLTKVNWCCFCWNRRRQRQRWYGYCGIYTCFCVGDVCAWKSLKQVSYKNYRQNVEIIMTV